jgi:short-subunit dehydrogenase
LTYFVTGATGFIGRHLVEQLLQRDGDVHVLVRAGSRERLDELIARWGGDAAQRIKPVVGDLGEPQLGVSDADRQALQGVDHVFHLAAIYDMTADDERNEQLNVAAPRTPSSSPTRSGRRPAPHVVDRGRGQLQGPVPRGPLRRGPGAPVGVPPDEVRVREDRRARSPPCRGGSTARDRRRPLADRRDGQDRRAVLLLQAHPEARGWLPQWFPLVGPELGYTNIVPVDYVAAAMDHIAHQPDLDGQAFHLTNPHRQHTGEVLNIFAEAAHAPQLQLRVDQKILANLPKGTLSLLMKAPPAKNARRAVLADFGIPEEVLDHTGLRPNFDTRDTERALKGTGIEVPELASYAYKLWDFWERHLDPDLYKDRSFEGAVNGKRVVITGASSGIGEAAAMKIAAAGGIPLLVARGVEKLEALKAEIEAAGGTAYVYSADLSDIESIDGLAAKVLDEHPTVDILVNNAGRSIRRSIALSYDRFHDFERTMQLNYFGAIRLTMALLPHMRARGSGHVVNISSIGAQTNPPRFSAYVASKAALDAWTRVVGSETIGDGVHFTTIHMQLVKTPMIAPTKIYDAFPTITPEEAGDLICEAIRARPKTINTRLGTFGEVAYALAPKAVDQILHTAYKVFPDSAAAAGKKDPSEKASMEQIAMANLMKGVHW